MYWQYRCEVLNLVAASSFNEPDEDIRVTDEIVEWLMEPPIDGYKMEAARLAFRDKHPVSNGSALARAKTYHAYIKKENNGSGSSVL